MATDNPTARKPVNGSLLIDLTDRIAATEALQEADADAAEIEQLMVGVDALRKLPIKDIVPPLSFRPVGAKK